MKTSLNLTSESSCSLKILLLMKTSLKILEFVLIMSTRLSDSFFFLMSTRLTNLLENFLNTRKKIVYQANNKHP